MGSQGWVPMGSQGGCHGVPGWAQGTHGTHWLPWVTYGLALEDPWAAPVDAWEGPWGLMGPPRGPRGGPWARAWWVVLGTHNNRETAIYIYINKIIYI